MGTLKLVLSIVEVIACVFLTVVVLLQQGARQGLSGSIAGGADGAARPGHIHGRPERR